MKRRGTPRLRTTTTRRGPRSALERWCVERVVRGRAFARRAGAVDASSRRDGWMGAENASHAFAFIRARDRHRARRSPREIVTARARAFHVRDRRREARTRRVRVERGRKRGCGSENGIIHSRRRTRDGTTQRTVFVRRMRTRRGCGWTRPRSWIRGRDRAHLSRV